MIKYPIDLSKDSVLDLKKLGLKVLWQYSETYSNDYCQWPPHMIMSIEASTFILNVDYDIPKRK